MALKCTCGCELMIRLLLQLVLPSSGSFIVGIVWPFALCSLSKKSDVEATCLRASTPSYDLFFTIDFGGN